MHEPRPVVAFSGGGTGGHLYPALALADELRRLDSRVRAVFFGARRGLEARVLPERGEAHVLLAVVGFARGGGLRNWRAIPALAGAVLRARRALRESGAELVVVTGGYAGAPAGLAAVLTRCPLVLQEQNSVPGVTTRLLARWATRIHVAYPEAESRLPPRSRARVVVSGNPVRPVPSLDAGEARRGFGLPEEGLVLLVTGGSQGSLALNRVVAEAVGGVADGALGRPAGLHLLWGTGRAHEAACRAALSAAGNPDWVHALPYFDDMPAALAAADFAVSRAGAMSTAELLNHALPAILVPLPTAAEGHQAANARALADAGTAVVLSEDGLTGATLWAEVTRIAQDGERRRAMSEAAARRARPDAARRIAEDLLSFLNPPREAA